VPVSGLQNLTAYHWFVNVTDGTHWTRKTFTFQTWFPTHFDPFQHGWQYRKQITIDHANVPEDLTDFPVLVSTVDSDLKVKAQADGDDILFMDNTGYAALLNYEIEQYDGSTGTLVAWVNIPQLSSQDDTIFYMYYGNPTTISLQNPEKTWDSHYLGVWHMNDATSSTIKDSTINGYDATKKAANQPAEWSAKIGKGQRYDRTLWDYIAVNDQNALTISGDFTISAWIFPYTTENMRIAGKHQDISGNYKGYSINWDLQGPGTKMSLRVDGGGYDYQYIYANEERPPNDWYSITGEKRQGTNLLFIDGEQQTGSGTQGLVNSGYPFCIGAWRTDAASANFNGIIDEVRVSSIGRSPAWITTEYNTMNNNQFLTIGPEEP